MFESLDLESSFFGMLVHLQILWSSSYVKVVGHHRSKKILKYCISVCVNRQCDVQSSPMRGVCVSLFAGALRSIERQSCLCYYAAQNKSLLLWRCPFAPDVCSCRTRSAPHPSNIYRRLAERNIFNQTLCPSHP